MSLSNLFANRISEWPSARNPTAAICVAALFAVASGAVVAASPAHAQGKPSPHAHTARPLVLTEQGSFFVDGEIVFSEFNFGEPDAPLFGPGDIAVNQMYVQYQIPKNKRYKYPVIMVHGGGHSGKTYETTPDGREGGLRLSRAPWVCTLWG